MKVQQLIFDDEITLWWMRQSVKAYHIFLDGRLFTVSAVTHVTFPDLLPLHDYGIRITGEDGDVLWEEVVRTREQKPTLTVTDAPYRAKGDGIRNNTAALQRALDDCPSGGRVRVPRGIFLTGALRMHSDTELYLEEGAVLRGSARASDYLPKLPSRFEGIERECYQSLLNIGYLDRSAGTTARNVAVRGRGVLEGGGRALFEDTVRAEKGEMRRTDEPLGAYARLMGNVPGWRVRGRLICICCAEQVIVSGIGIRTAPSWNIHMIYSRDVTTYGCRFESRGIENGDGWNPDSSVRCTLFGCDFRVGDDCIAIKSGKNPEGNRIGLPCRGIRIFDCRSIEGHGIAIGSELSGGIDDVRIWDCDFSASEYGLHFKTTPKRGGFVRNVTVEHCSFPRLTVESVRYNDDGESAGEPTVMENIVLRDITLSGVCWYANEEKKPGAALAVTGDGYLLRSLSLCNVRISDNGLMDFRTLTMLSGIRLENPTFVKDGMKENGKELL